MKKPDEPLEWSEHFPPTDPVKKFFIGVRWLGPDLSFFKELRNQQAGRTLDNMSVWPISEERDLALLMGKHFQSSIKWPTRFFLPDDRFYAIAHGPKFVTVDGDVFFEEALLGIEKEMGVKLPDSFWRQTADWKFRDVIQAMVKEAKKKRLTPSP